MYCSTHCAKYAAKAALGSAPVSLFFDRDSVKAGDHLDDCLKAVVDDATFVPREGRLDWIRAELATAYIQGATIIFIVTGETQLLGHPDDQELVYPYDRMADHHRIYVPPKNDLEAVERLEVKLREAFIKKNLVAGPDGTD